MSTAAVIQPISKLSLVDHLASQLQALIGSGRYAVGERLPSINQMAREYNVGPPTLREAIKRIEALGLVSVRHGSGVYVRSLAPPIFLTNPIHSARPGKKLLLDLVEARKAVEVQAAGLAARHATPEQISTMDDLLAQSAEALRAGNPALVNQLNLAFHGAIAKASGNVVLCQMVEQIVDLFREEQRMILDIHGPRDRDHQEHEGLVEVIRGGDESLAREAMEAHLDGVRIAIERWDGADLDAP